MNKVLYVFDFEKLDDFKLNFPSQNFVSIALILNLAPNVENIDDLDEDFIDNCIIDITALSFDNGYYKLFLERYLYALIERFENVEFSINSIKKDVILEKFPYMFDETSEEYSVISDESRGEENIAPTGEINITPVSYTHLDVYKRQAVALSGLPKQEYCYRRCLNQDVIVQGNPRVFKALKTELAAVLAELQRIEAGNSVDEELLNVIELIAVILGGLKGEDTNGE